jgi:hypothetical protein
LEELRNITSQGEKEYPTNKQKEEKVNLPDWSHVEQELPLNTFLNER